MPLTQPIILQGQIHRQALLKQTSEWLNSSQSQTQTQAQSQLSYESQTQSQLQLQLQSSSTNDATASYSDTEIDNNTHWLDIGIDEVGRGPLYGSVVVAAAILPEAWSAETDQLALHETVLADITDSKKLTEVKRERLFEPIKKHALAYLIVDVPAAVIDEINILQATLQAMRLASEQLMLEVVSLLEDSLNIGQVNNNQKQQVGFKLLIDGNKLPSLDSQTLASHGIGESSRYPLQSEAWVKGDARHTAIAAASILAKVTRDRQLVIDGQRYPGYGLEKHKGYPTKTHIEALHKLGVLPEHRRSYKPVQLALADTGPVK
ncbi:ribonuclease HII [Psychrobacter sp. FDAARGOS_221]|nr:ribonuclease HII [Psychrobacter sp. FDAARGOS_221]